MLDHLARRVLTLWPSRLVPGEALHRRALAALALGRFVAAEELFEAAAADYRRELRVEPLARLRVHQRMARARALADPAREAECMLEIVRVLNRLDRLEAMTPPFALVDAREVLARWLAERPQDVRVVGLPATAGAAAPPSAEPEAERAAA